MQIVPNKIQQNNYLIKVAQLLQKQDMAEKNSWLRSTPYNYKVHNHKDDYVNDSQTSWVWGLLPNTQNIMWTTMCDRHSDKIYDTNRMNHSLG